MINLLPDDVKKEIIYGRRNRILRHWVLLVCLVVIVIAATTVVGELLINRNINSTEITAKLTQTQISNQNLAATQTEIQSLSNNFRTVTRYSVSSCYFPNYSSRLAVLFLTALF